MLTEYTMLITDVLGTSYGKLTLIVLIFLAGFGMSLVPETVAAILPRLAGHIYKRIYFAIGMTASIIVVGVISSRILGPTSIGGSSYVIWGVLLVAMSLQAFEWIAFIHPAPLKGRDERRIERARTPIGRTLAIVKQGLLVGLSWRYDRLPIYIWLVATIAVAGWKLASVMIISFIIGYLIPVFWLTNRLERLAKLVTQPNYRTGIFWFKRLMGVVMWLEALYFIGLLVTY